MCQIKIIDYISCDFHRSQGYEQLSEVDKTNSWKTSFKIIKLVFPLLKLATLLFYLSGLRYNVTWNESEVEPETTLILTTRWGYINDVTYWSLRKTSGSSKELRLYKKHFPIRRLLYCIWRKSLKLDIGYNDIWYVTYVSWDIQP